VEHRMAHADGSLYPAMRRIRPAMSDSLDHAFEKGGGNWPSIELIDAGEPAHAGNRRMGV
jgi:hypothetical protein